MFKVALLAVVGAMTVVPALAQDNFPDVPENHWAFEAVENLKREGILVGYPDGRVRGSRFMTRYEFAVALNAAYKKLMSMNSGLADQIEEMKKMVGTGSDGDLKAQLSDLQKQLAAMKSWGDDIAAMKKMAGTFEKELASLGVDVEAMKKDLEAMKGGRSTPMM
ncbi:MAG: S-layer homology domain-containing protein, partial [Chthonomonadaceae bacterium]|nr:S-layer homology domain-containing protein [Chthonomonadaceae bacterium]